MKKSEENSSLFLFAKVARAHAVRPAEHFREVVVIPDPATLRDFAHGKIGRFQKFGGVTKSSQTHKFGGGTAVVLADEGIELPPRKQKFSAKPVHAEVAADMFRNKRFESASERLVLFPHETFELVVARTRL